MKKTLLTLALFFFGTSLAYAGARSDCMETTGATWVNNKCFCPENFKLEGGKCVAQVCKDETKKVAQPTTTKRKRAPKVVVEPKLPSCSLDKVGIITANKPGETIPITMECDPGSGVIGNMSAECHKDCTLDGGATTENRKQKPSKRPVPTREVFMVKPTDLKGGTPAMVTFVAEAKDGSSIPASVTIKWPVETPPVPPPPPVPVRSPAQIACEDHDGGKFDPVTAKCECPKPLEPGVWTDASGNLHLCKNPPPQVIKAKDGKDGTDGVTKVVHVGDSSHLTVALVGTGIMIDKDLATGAGLTLGGSWSFGTASKWRFNIAAGLMLAPTPEYRADGKLTRDESGNVAKNNIGFLAFGGVSCLVLPQLELGLGAGYWRFGQHWSGNNSGKGTYEAMGAVGDIVYYPHKGETMSVGLALSPMLGMVWGGKSPDARITSGATLGVRFLF